MDNPRPEKVAVVDEVRGRLDSASGALLTEYRGLKVSELAELRRSLRAVGGEYKVYKNTLVRFAVADRNLPELEALLTGPTAIAFVEGDVAAVAKALRDFARTNPNLVVKGGLLGGNLIDPAGAAALADLPSREVLLARLAGGLAAPLQQLAGLLQALPRNMAYGLKALIDQRGGPVAPTEPEQSGEAPVVVQDSGDTEGLSASDQSGEAASDGSAQGGSGEARDAEVSASDTEAAVEAAEAAAPPIDSVSDSVAAGDEAASPTGTVTAEAQDDTATPTEASDGATETEQ